MAARTTPPRLTAAESRLVTNYRRLRPAAQRLICRVLAETLRAASIPAKV